MGRAAMKVSAVRHIFVSTMFKEQQNKSFARAARFLFVKQHGLELKCNFAI